MLQRLYISRDCSKLMEVLDDSKCHIYEFSHSEDFRHKSMEPKLLYQIKKYPTPLQGTTSANFLFSPNFTYFFDVDSTNNNFIIKQSSTNQTVFSIPRGLFGFKNTDTSRFSASDLAKNLMFIDEKKIRIINKYGLDTVMEFDEQEPSNPKIKSIAKIDNYSNNGKKSNMHHHSIVDQTPIKESHTFERLVRMGQKLKVFMQHKKTELEEYI